MHAVRRIPGATVLDYSLTPLADAAHSPGTALASTVDLGLVDPQAGDPQVFLLEPRTRRIYRPLVHGTWHRTECLCTPVALVQQNLHLARTSLLQAVFPELPPNTATIDVDVTSVPPFWNVPVTPAGMVPLASSLADLTRAADDGGPVPSTPPFRTPGGQVFDISVDAVYTARSYTALAWTIGSVTAGSGLPATTSPPFREVGVAGLVDKTSAGAPTVQPSGQLTPVLRSRLATAGSRRRCLCTDLSRPADLLQSAGRQVSAVTVLPALPQPTAAVDVSFPGAAVLRDVPTTVASDGAFRSAGPVRQPVGYWGAAAGPPLGWSSDEWPTPVPGRRAVDRFQPVVGDLVR